MLSIYLFGVRLFIEGAWQTITLDGRFPMNLSGNFCGARINGRQIWILLLQKAWAKVFGSYDNIIGGQCYQGLNAITGAPSLVISVFQREWLQRIERQLKRGSIVTCSTAWWVSLLSQKQQKWMGISENHAYTLLDIYPNVETAQRKVTLLRVRNPHGQNDWQGDWGFNSGLWTTQLREKLNYIRHPKDGSFFINLYNFVKVFQQLHISRVDPSYQNSWIYLQSYQHEFKGVRVRVGQQGKYYFSVCQEHQRKYRGKHFHKAKSWIFILKEDKEGRKAVKSKFTVLKDNTIVSILDPGEYIIAVRVQWKTMARTQLTLSCYGPQRMVFKAIKNWDVTILTDFIGDKARTGVGEKKVSDRLNILQEKWFSRVEGFGYLKYYNQEPSTFRVKLTFEMENDLTLLPPHEFPLKLKVKPGEEVICMFVVDPDLSYLFTEKCKLIKGKQKW